MLFAFIAKKSEKEKLPTKDKVEYIKPKKKSKRKKKKSQVYQSETIDTVPVIKGKDKAADTSSNFSDLKPQDSL